MSGLNFNLQNQVEILKKFSPPPLYLRLKFTACVLF